MGCGRSSLTSSRSTTPVRITNPDESKDGITFNENDENIANHILSILVDPGPSDIITLEIPSSYYVYAYYINRFL